MIPVSLPSISFIVLLSLSGLVGLLLLGWLASLAMSSRMRKAFGKFPKLFGSLMIVMMLFASFSVWVRYEFWKIEREIGRQRAALNVILEHPARLGDIAMPVGTKLLLAQVESLESFKEAEFPYPLRAYGLDAIKLVRYVSTDYDPDTYAVRGTYPTSLSLFGKGSQAVQGWHCDTTHAVEFDLNPDASIKAFGNCRLAAGNVVAGLEVPKGSLLQHANGTMYVDGFRDNDLWHIRVEHDEAVRFLELPLSRFGIRLDNERQLLAIDDAILACDLDLGALRYRAGTMVKSVGRGLRERFPGAYIFSPVGDRVARHQEHEVVPDGMSVIQWPTGEVAAIVPNAQAGVMRFATFEMSGATPVTPKPADCP